MRLHKPPMVVILALLILGLSGWWVLGRAEQESPVVTSRVKRGTVTETVLATGMLEARELVSVGARVSGQIETLAVRLGQTIKAGDLIAQIDSQDQQNTVLQAEAALANIEAQIAAKEAVFERASLSLERLQQLGANSYASKEAIEAANADVKVYRADLDALKAQKSNAEVTVATARLALERTKVTAPIDGTVVAIVVKQGQTVNAAQSAPTIVKLADLSSMVVKAEISEADVMNVVPGQRVSFTTLGAPDLPFEAVVTEIEPAPTEITDSDTISSDNAVYYNGLLEVDNSEGLLRIGMTTEVRIELARASGVLTVPSAAIRTSPDGSFVEVYDPQTETRERRAVEVGLNDKVIAEIQKGLNGDERVVIAGEVARGSPGPNPGNNAGSQRRMRPPSMF